MGRHPHVEKPGDGPWGVDCMNRGQHEVARDSGTHGDLGGLPIPDFAHYDDVGILPEDGSKGHREGQPREWAHLDLINPGDPVLHGILERDHIEPLLVQLGQSAEQTAALSTSGWSGGEDHALPCLTESAYEGRVALGETECVEVSRHLKRIQKPQHDLFTPCHR